MTTALVRFYRGDDTDDRGRRLDDLWRWNHDTLEWTHDYIQWLFPLREPSGANPYAPLLDDETIATFRADPDLAARVRRSLELMLDFYGFRREAHAGGVRVADTAEAAARRRVWITPGNHNFLRLTRILKSLRLLGLEAEARALFDALTRVYDGPEGRVIGERTYAFWKEAVG